jgi:monofunctional glycosyltransferase
MKAAAGRRSLPRVARGVVGAAAASLALLGYSWLLLPDVRSLASRNPETTAFMERRAAEAAERGRTWRPTWRWASSRRISPELKRAVLLAEDAGFWGHEGIAVAELRASVQESLDTLTFPRGASTITQQLAKNLYLSSSRNPYRKLVELMIARRLEHELPKTRILELYLNVVEWGDGIWGAEAAAQTYFGKAAADLSAGEAALLAGALINPRVYSPARPNARLLRRQQIILGRMNATSSSNVRPVEPTNR